MIYNKLTENIDLQTGKLALVIIAVAVICIAVTVVLSRLFQGWTFLLVTGAFLVVAMICSYCAVETILRPFIAVEKGISEFSRNRSFRYNEEAASPAIRDVEKGLNDLFDEICEADEASRDLIRNISHEVKTPLTSLKIVAEGIKDGVFPADEKHIKLILEDVERIDETITTIRIYSSIDDDTDTDAQCDLMPVLMSSYERAKRIGADTIDVSLKGVPDPEHTTYVPASPAMLATVFDSISANAFEHADGMTHLEFSFKTITVQVPGETPAQMLKVSIADNGCGIAEPEKMIRAFWKLDDSRNKDGKVGASLGLGLSICDKMMNSIGGKLNVTSKEGIGTCVSLWFPLCEE